MDLYTVTVPADTEKVYVDFGEIVNYTLYYSNDYQDDNAGNGVSVVEVMPDMLGTGTIDSCAFLDMDQAIDYYAITFVYADGGSDTVPEEKIEISEASGTPIATVTSTVENGTATLHVTAENPCVVVVKKADGTYERQEAVKNGDSYDFSQSGYTSDMEFHVLLKGDANGDGIVSTDDAMQLAQACLSTTHPAYLEASELIKAAYGTITTDLAMQIARSCLSSDHAAYHALTW